MSESELLLIGISLMLATALVRCVDGLYHATISKKGYWIPQVLLWTCFFYFSHFLWSFKDNLSENPSYIFYMSSLIVSSTFILRVHILTSSNPEKIDNWEDHFKGSARPYFVLSIVSSIFAIVGLRAANESTGFDLVSVPFWFAVLLNLTGAISEKAGVRGTVAITHFTLVILGGYILFSRDLL